jgi:hypothetical protein
MEETMGRPPIGARAMTAAERQRRRRAIHYKPPAGKGDNAKGLILAVIQNAKEKQNLARRNLHHVAPGDRAEIAAAINGLIRKWESLKRKL